MRKKLIDILKKISALFMAFLGMAGTTPQVNVSNKVITQTEVLPEHEFSPTAVPSKKDGVKRKKKG